MKLVLDTNRYTDFCRGVNEVVSTIQQASAICLPFVVVAELRAGFAAGTLAKANEAILQRFLASPRVALLYADNATINLYAGLYNLLRKQGTPVPTHDLWIAALAIQHNAHLCSRDHHFDHLPQLLRC